MHKALKRKTYNVKTDIVSEYLLMMGSFGQNHVDELKKGCEKDMKINIDAVCAEIGKLKKGEKFREVMFGKTVHTVCELGFLIGLGTVLLTATFLQDIYNAWWSVSALPPLGVFVGIVWLVARYFGSLEKANDRLILLEHKIYDVIYRLKRIHPYVAGKKDSAAGLGVIILAELALDIISMEKAMPEGATATHAIREARQKIRETANVFERVGVHDGTLDWSFSWAANKWEMLARDNPGSIDYAI